ncbi:hypothetical protein HQ45_08565 [Porphyromonas crevioricanis]|uniref:DUF4835 domain-containing protein n=1 Tax=Porphyromonas crevioricanis TaxID=393921 RepID=A0AB34PEI7_9PORP|nr:hypothetical protein HQ45_08565 [Porphyromonas crevioricanis]KGN93890.1 hypothetical protein HQ38_07700 [Porphyromonas crevioricanis]
MLFLLLPLQGLSQELNAKVSINTDALGGSVERSQYEELERKLSELLNNTRWTHGTFSPAERIECNFSLNILTRTDETKYTADLSVTARRPVFNASYVSPLFVYRDRELNFLYDPYTPIEWNPANIESNLLATLIFYTYAILTYDFDSFAPLGGNPYRSEMRQLVAAAQTKQDWNGWDAFKSDRNRYALAEALNDPVQEPVRKAWYIFHRKGLDEMVGNANRGRSNIISTIELLETVHKEKPVSPLLNIFAMTKLEELVSILSKASTSEKQDLSKRLLKLFPTEQNKIDRLKK